MRTGKEKERHLYLLFYTQQTLKTPPGNFYKHFQHSIRIQNSHTHTHKLSFTQMTDREGNQGSSTFHNHLKTNKQTKPETKQNKNLGIALTKQVKDLNNKKCKILENKGEDNIRIWKDLPCSWVRKINILKMATIPKVI